MEVPYETMGETEKPSGNKCVGSCWSKNHVARTVEDSEMAIFENSSISYIRLTDVF